MSFFSNIEGGNNTGKSTDRSERRQQIDNPKTAVFGDFLMNPVEEGAGHEHRALQGIAGFAPARIVTH
ncbi:hypothetical protein ACCS91_40050, partial [Rhizobium ruizarguesonis]